MEKAGKGTNPELVFCCMGVMEEKWCLGNEDVDGRSVQVTMQIEKRKEDTIRGKLKNQETSWRN